MNWRDAPAADFAVIGHPVKHSLSPAMHMAAYSALGLPYRYVAIDVPPTELAEALKHLARAGYMGVNVTVPLKESAFELTTPDSVANAAHAVNTINLQDLRATLTDGKAFWKIVERRPGKVLVLGSGGTARAILTSAHSRDVWLWARNTARALELHDAVLETLDADGFSVVVNATAATMHGEDLPVIWDGTPGLAIDVMYGVPSSFLARAEASGWKVMDGKRLLLEQGALAFEWWLGIPAPREAMWGAIA